MKDKILYFVIGVLITTILFLSIAATTNSSSNSNRYQFSSGVSPAIFDTQTGEIKILHIKGGNVYNQVLIYDVNDPTKMKKESVKIK